MDDLSTAGRHTSENGFTNVGRAAWWQRGFFASQTAYVVLAFLIITIAISFVADNFLSPENLLRTSQNFSYVGIVALGATLVIITGGIDLSVGSVMALTAVVTMIVMKWIAETALGFVSMPLALLIGLAISGFIGLVNGLLIARLKLSPFVVTLGMLSICRGLTYVITKGRSQAPGGPGVDTFYALTNGKLFGLPIPLVYLLVGAAIMGFVLHHTAAGRHIFAIGGNERAAALTGVAVERVKIGVYVACSATAGFAGILMSGWLGAAQANLATGYELTIIAAAVIGGANLAGGTGGPVGAIIGAALIEVIRNGLVLAGADSYWQTAIIGMIIIFAAIVDRLRSLRAA
ncbi:ABC transporter permease [Chelatococcus sp. YT9]|uniref:ABC transporter permease n=1 Tax=Chelatococcus sp. YT9 TaxID=2835635 RepID=UPI001BD064DB|nr:ABC transporter permease [Chelatococcus sp. YT9]MBS7698828.1 ABC transporter permease [Chelatococcus sp. YT9]